MDVSQILANKGLRALKLPLRQVPHVTIETNRTCNVHCQSCYNLNKSYVKSFETIKVEVDLALQKRNIQIFSLMGGEPTLHPQLPEIVAYIKSKKRLCQVLTNGIVFLQESGDGLLNRLIAAGIDRILLHVDSGQKDIHRDIEQVRRALFQKMEEKSVPFLLSLTIYEDSVGTIPQAILRYSEYRYFAGILALVERNGILSGTRRPRLEDEYVHISRELMLEPVTYIPSNLRDRKVCWLLYFYLINSTTKKTFGLSTELCMLFGWFYKLIHGRHFFVFKRGTAAEPWLSGMAGLAETAVHPKRTGEFLKLISRPLGFRALRLHHVAVQNLAEFNKGNNRYEFCYHCPDATIRNGKLIPVCIADQVSPLNSDRENIVVDKNLLREVYEHLEEIRESKPNPSDIMGFKRKTTNL